jgi:hypothetical protein
MNSNFTAALYTILFVLCLVAVLFLSGQGKRQRTLWDKPPVADVEKPKAKSDNRLRALARFARGALRAQRAFRARRASLVKTSDEGLTAKIVRNRSSFVGKTRNRHYIHPWMLATGQGSGMCSARSGTIGFLGGTGTTVFDGTGTTKIMISGTFSGDCALALLVMNVVEIYLSVK